MDDRFREIYATLYVQRTSAIGGSFSLRVPAALRRTPYESREWGEQIRDAIEAAQASARRRLREDAKAVLAVNFLDLIVLPLILGGQTRGDVGGLSEDVRADIVMLVTDVAEVQNRELVPEEDGEISGHEVIDSLSRNWERLRVSRWRLWEQ